LIFVTVGAQMPFDRLIQTVDEWAAERGRRDVFAQTAEGDYKPVQIQSIDFLDTDEFDSHFNRANVIVGHAGTGTILTALQLCKPVLVMPRRAALGETRNDHQVATADRFGKSGRIAVAMNEAELRLALDDLSSLKVAEAIGPHAEPELLQAIRSFIVKA